MPEWLAFLMALAVNAIYSLGMVLQKKGIGWQTKGRVHDLAWRRERRMWLLGFLMVMIIPFLNFIVLYSLSPVVVGSMAGSCVVFTAFFSALILKVKLGLREIAASATLFAGIILFAIFTDAKDSTNWSRPFFVMTWLFPFAGAGSGWLLMRIRMQGRTFPRNTGPFQSNPYGALMGAATGTLGGALIIIMKLFQIECGTNLLCYPLTIFMYAHISVGIAGPFLMQAAFRHGSISAVTGAIYGSQLVYPVITAWFIFSITPHPLQLVGLGAIFASVFVLAFAPAVSEAVVPGKPM